MPRLAVRAILIEDDKILLAHFIDDSGPWYVTPGGGVQHGETLSAQRSPAFEPRRRSR